MGRFTAAIKRVADLFDCCFVDEKISSMACRLVYDIGKRNITLATQPAERAVLS